MKQQRLQRSRGGGDRVRMAVCGLALVCLVSTTASCSTQTRGASGSEQGEAQFNRPINMVVGYGPGGGSDQAARIAAPPIGQDLGVEVPVVNSPGGSGNTAVTSLLGDPPGESISLYTDGNTTAVASGIASYESEELQGVCRLQEQSSGILLKGDGPYEDWEQLAAAAKERPGELTVGTAGQGGQDDVMLAALAEQGIDFRAVPYSEPNERYAALLGGSVDALYEQPGDLADDIDSGQMKPAMMFVDEPVEGLEGDYVLGPEIGVDLSLTQSRGIVTSAEATPEQVSALSDACATTQENQEFREFEERNFSNPESFMNAEEYDRYLQDQLKRFRELTREYDVG